MSDTSRQSAHRVRMTSAERREQLIEVATQVFASEGADRASVESIASRAGVSKPVIYEHFGSKDGLYLSLIHISEPTRPSHISRMPSSA